MKEQHGYSKTLDQYKAEKILEIKNALRNGELAPMCYAPETISLPGAANVQSGIFKRCDYESISEISRKVQISYLYFQALDRNEDVPEQTFTDFHVSEYLESFDSETDYIGLMIASVKYQNEWYHDGRKHENISKRFGIMLNMILRKYCI